VQVLQLCPRWGSEDMPIEMFLRRALDSGYDGVELALPDQPKDRGVVLDALAASRIPWVGQHYQTLDSDFFIHRDAYVRRLRLLAEARPMLVNAHTGRDHFTFEQNRELLEAAREVEAQSGVPIVHETHRGRFGFAAHVTRSFLEALPWLRLTLDVSHWFNVAESFLEDQADALALALERADHVHARVGFSEGPQVPDPRAPEAHEVLEVHLAIWDRVVKARRASGARLLGFTAEFGPKPYMPHLPFANTPVADQWEVNWYMQRLLRARYAGGAPPK